MRKEKKLSPFEKKLNDWVAKHLTRISFVQKIFFVDHLRTMLHASLSVVEALEILSKEMSSKKFRLIIGYIKQEVESGRQLSEVLAGYPDVFPPIYVKMMEAGEVAGKLDESLEQIVVQMKKTHALTSSIRGAMIYPSVIIIAMVGVGIVMATVVLPNLVKLFEEFDTELPLATRIFIAIINFVNNPLNLTLTVGTVIFLVVGFGWLLKKSAPFRRVIHTMNLYFPIIGGVIKKINLARFSLTLSSLLKSTIPIIHAVEITADTCTNVRFQESIRSAGIAIKSGTPLSEVLAQSPKLFPPMVTEMILVGERSGEVDRLLTELSSFYGDEVDKTMKNFTAVIEPIIILVLGVAVAGVAVAVILPMYTLIDNF